VKSKSFKSSSDLLRFGRYIKGVERIIAGFLKSKVAKEFPKAVIT
jgi:hypothetical protein